MMLYLKRILKRYLPPKVKTFLKEFIVKHDIDFGRKAKLTKAAISVQNQYNLTPLQAAAKIIVFLVPNDAEISGGLLSIFQFVNFTREIEKNAVCIISTIPGKYTYEKMILFKNSEQIYRWEQVITSCHQCSELILHVPEYFASFFYGFLSRRDLAVLRALPKLRINILNQNIDYMPSRESLYSLYSLTSDVSQSAGFERYANQDVCDKFGMPLYFVPSYINLDDCVVKEFSEKKKLILFSNDQHSDKKRILSRIQDEFIDYEIREISGLTYAKFLELIAQARFVISFGEGFDGYYIQPYYAKSIGISVYNDRFFPDSAMCDFPFVYSSFEEMYEKVCDDIRRVKDSKEDYEEISSSVHSYLVRTINHPEKTVVGLKNVYDHKVTYCPDGQARHT